MSLVEFLLGILVIQMFVLITDNKKRNGIIAEASENEHHSNTSIKNELGSIRHCIENGLITAVTKIEEEFYRLDDNIRRGHINIRMNHIEDHLEKISGNTNRIRENTKIR